MVVVQLLCLATWETFRPALEPLWTKVDISGAQGSGHPQRRPRREPLRRRDRELLARRHVLRDRPGGQERQGDARGVLALCLGRPQGGPWHSGIGWWPFARHRWP